MPWGDLNQRQQDYMKAIYTQDQLQEQNERSRSARTMHSRPADEWRWILYANTMYGHTPLKQQLKDAGLVDPGTGSTFKALEERGYILTVSESATPHRRSELIVNVRLTTKGRKLVRQALGITAPATLPTGMLREWHWRALCRAYVCGEDGLGYDVDTGDGYGYVSWKTCLRLRDYMIKAQDKALIKERHLSEMRDGQQGLVITEYGKQYYRENWQRYRDLYPDVEAPAPDSVPPV